MGLGLGVRQDVVDGPGGDRREPRMTGGLRRLPGVAQGRSLALGSAA